MFLYIIKVLILIFNKKNFDITSLDNHVQQLFRTILINK